MHLIRALFVNIVTIEFYFIILNTVEYVYLFKLLKPLPSVPNFNTSMRRYIKGVV